jgi:hypothetical protein
MGNFLSDITQEEWTEIIKEVEEKCQTEYFPQTLEDKRKFERDFYEPFTI